MDRLADFRSVFAQVVVARAGCAHNRALLHAFATVPRHAFLGAGPWLVSEHGARTTGDDPACVYQDIGFGLAAGIPNGLPSLHAQLLDAAAPQLGDRVMHVGAGTGYYTAILAELVGPTGHVRGFEIDQVLAARARDNLAAWPWAHVEPRSGVHAPEQPVDLIYVNAGVQQLPRPWIDALALGGRLVVPLVPASGHGAVFAITRDARGYAARHVCPARFVPCIGAQDAALGERLEPAFRSPALAGVRSLRFAEPPAAAVCLAGDGWWLSSDPPA
ncbi:MAG TPA: hypothetical protein VHN14_12470 [Kofleriaceae bacterium]|jgi:protein-L-isoaspartate(D-aspartate) O-methyltransferase|nr:hypothetical protein [Kofleriaceae bacterium]